MLTGMDDVEKLRQAFSELRDAKRALGRALADLSGSDHRALWEKVQTTESQLGVAIGEVQHRLHMSQHG